MFISDSNQSSEIDEQLNFKSAGVLITNKQESFQLLKQVKKTCLSWHSFIFLFRFALL